MISAHQEAAAEIEQRTAEGHLRARASFARIELMVDEGYNTTAAEELL